jgi:hypothetical protein
VEMMKVEAIMTITEAKRKIKADCLDLKVMRYFTPQIFGDYNGKFRPTSYFVERKIVKFDNFRIR